MITDMWSLGIVCAVLLTGKSVFDNTNDDHASPATIVNATADFDLAKTFHSPLWQSVTTSAKDFVRNLLVLDEKERLNVDQALEHNWFTERRNDIKQQYDQAIRGWLPSKPLLDFKEDLAIAREASRDPRGVCFSRT